MSRVHPIFHVSLLRKFEEPGELFPERTSLPNCTPIQKVDGKTYYEIETLLDKRSYYNKTQYLIKWQGLPLYESEWQTCLSRADPTWKDDLHHIDRFEEGQSEVLSRGSVKSAAKTRALKVKSLACHQVFTCDDSKEYSGKSRTGARCYFRNYRVTVLDG